MVGILWFSRHDLTDEQKYALFDYFNDEIDIQQIDKTVSSASEILENWNGHRGIVAVLPTYLLSDLMAILKSDEKYSMVEVLIPVNARLRNEQGEYYFKHLRFDVVKECKYVVVPFE